ncbi:37S ribosomal protein S25, mitochondrial [Lachnellula occidentalis]|uniref:37S ribosomal protein S25, mitochondrial n=1 Tax=Lachnellula occidentalis TaxID=215460 RepID=A0A8H8UKT2_9HELO|nr:37S ribosomal protein S25, mitochondrial [Lachnellula occidentalis]
MRGRNLKPSRVYQTALRLLESQSIEQPPVWFNTIGSIPPGEILTRTQPAQHRETKFNSRIRKPSKMFKPQPIEYEEDQLRREFYNDHPWELARPRIVLENDGRDGQRCDWSRIQQLGRPLSGESVVQRQLWLIQNNGLPKNAAYDVARKEFYALRHEQEVERRVAKEEAMWTGAYFGKSMLEIGMQLEDKVYEGWRVWARTEIEAADRDRDAAYTDIPEADHVQAADDMPVEEPVAVQ